MIAPNEVGAPADGRATPFVVRPAAAEDVPGMAALIAALAERDLVLPRSAAAIAASLEHWVVAVVPADAAARLAIDEALAALKPGSVVACGSLLDYRSDLTEVRSLAVDPAVQGLGLGRSVVDALVAAARRRGIETVFALTRAVPFFERQGFTVTAKERFPEKVWRDCIGCPLLERCDEVAVVLGRADGMSGPMLPAEAEERNERK